MIVKKIRIAVTIDSDGEWAAGGWSYIGPDLNTQDLEKQMIESSNLDTDCEIAQYWITAEIEVPQKKKINEIKGTASKYE